MLVLSFHRRANTRGIVVHPAPGLLSVLDETHLRSKFIALDAAMMFLLHVAHQWHGASDFVKHYLCNAKQLRHR